MATPGAINIQLVWQLAAADWSTNSLWYFTPLAFELDQLDATEFAADILAAAVSAGLANSYNNQVRLDRIRVRDHRTDGNPVFEAVVGVLGAQVAAMLPRQTCSVTTLRTAFVTRRGRGRVFWPAVTITGSDTQGVGVPAVIVRLNNFTQNIFELESTDVGPIHLSVFSRVDNQLREVVGVSTDTIFDVQTRRRDVAI